MEIILKHGRLYHHQSALEWFSLGYTTPVNVTGITTVESFNGGHVAKIELIDTTNAVHVVYDRPNGSYYDLATDFTTTNIPNDPWTYGYKTTLGGAFIPFAYALAGGSLYSPTFLVDYRSNAVDGFPSILKNNTASIQTLNNTAPVPVGKLAMYPGPSGEYASARWTSPVDMSINVSVTYTKADISGGIGGPTVQLNGVTIFSALVSPVAGSTTATFNSTIVITKGDILDFMLGFGSDLNYFNDMTLVDVSIIPTPGTIVKFNPTWALTPYLVKGVKVTINNSDSYGNRLTRLCYMVV